MRTALLFIIGTCSIALVRAQDNTVPVPVFDFLLEYPSARDFTMSADGSEAYLTLQNQMEDIAVIVRTTKKGKGWTKPQLVPFTGKYRDIEPFLSPDGLRLYFSSDKPVLDTASQPKDYDIWYVERKDKKSKWSSPVNLGAPVNSEHNEFFPSLSQNGNLYFTSDWESSTGKDDIYFSKWQNGYTPPVPLGPAINSEGFEFNAYIAPDESFIIYTGYNRKEGYGSGDLYISYRQPDGQWGESKNLGPNINSKWMEYCPFVDFHAKTLYFTSRRSHTSTAGFSSLRDFRSEVTRYDNGLSRIYTVNLEVYTK